MPRGRKKQPQKPVVDAALAPAETEFESAAASRINFSDAATRDDSGSHVSEAGRNEASNEDGGNKKESEGEAGKGKLSLKGLQDRLFNVRMKMNQGRKANKAEVEDEYKRFADPKYEARQRYLNKRSEGMAAGDGSIGAAVVEVDSVMQQTAEQAERVMERAEEKARNIATFGWAALTTDASHRAYEKRLKKLPTHNSNTGSSSETQGIALPDAFDYGSTAASKVSAAGLDRLSKDISEREEARAKFSRKRLQTDAADVDYINDKNAAYNKKLKRAFDKYTVEIRQNLERGTAI